MVRVFVFCLGSLFEEAFPIRTLTFDCVMLCCLLALPDRFRPHFHNDTKFLELGAIVIGNVAVCNADCSRGSDLPTSTDYVHLAHTAARFPRSGKALGIANLVDT